MSIVDQIREFWDQDAATYDHDPGHHPTSTLTRAAWRSALEDLLPAAPARVLDVGAGTGFLSLLIAELGHRVTALDISAGMLEQLARKALAAQVAVDTVTAEAREVPSGPFDVVVSRHLVWTLTDPVADVTAWRSVAPSGRLILVDRDWADQGASQLVRRLGQQALELVRPTPPPHHASYPPEITRALPLGEGASPQALVHLVSSAGWQQPRVRRLRDVDWAIGQEQPWIDRLVSTAPHFAVVALAPDQGGGRGEAVPPAADPSRIPG